MYGQLADTLHAELAEVVHNVEAVHNVGAVHTDLHIAVVVVHALVEVGHADMGMEVARVRPHNTLPSLLDLDQAAALDKAVPSCASRPAAAAAA
jgi:hypothetical protein